MSAPHAGAVDIRVAAGRAVCRRCEAHHEGDLAELLRFAQDHAGCTGARGGAACARG